MALSRTEWNRGRGSARVNVVETTAGGAKEAGGGFARFAWALLAYNLLVVLWGAVVRATGSGAGCGGHWPLCNGQWAPTAPAIQTLIEYTHRVMSGISLAGVGTLAVWAFRRSARGSPVRKYAALAAAFLCIEALLGAGLVLFDYVAGNVSLGRAFYLDAATVTPVLSSFLLKKGMKETHNPVWQAFHHGYHKLFVRILRWPRLTLAIILVVLAAGLSFFPYLGGEFLPKLEEGNIWARATMPLSSSLAHGSEVTRGVRRVFMTFPEVSQIVSQLGRPDDGTDATGFFNAEFFVNLKPEADWPKGLTKKALIGQIDEKLKTQFPGVSFGYSQNIEDNIDEAMSGVKGANVVKVYGPDLAADERIANEVNEVMGGIPGMVDTAVYRSMGQPNLLITPDRKACARYGLNVGDVANIVQAAIGGQAITQVLEGDRRFDLTVRWQPKYRQSLDAIKQIRVAMPAGGYVPLSQVASIKTGEGASFIYHEGLRRYVPMRFGVRGRDLQTTIEDAKRAVAKQIKLPEGAYLDWVGEYSELQESNRRLEIAIPVAVLIVMGILYAATLSIINTFILMAQIPLACLGGVLALVITGTPMSVSAAVGFISIFAIAIMDGILLNFYIFQLWEEGYTVVDSIVMGADRRFRALMMTALVDGLGLLPAALSTRIGAQTQRPLAIVVIGGAISIALLTRVFQPTLVYLLHKQLGLCDEGERLEAPPFEHA